MPVNEKTGLGASAIESVFAGESQTPHAVFAKARVENAGSVANHRANDLAMECPICKGGVRLFSKEGTGYYCMNQHRWLDYEELMALKPAKLDFKGIVARQDGHVKYTISLAQYRLDDLNKKFGARLEATIANVLAVLSGRFLILTENDLEQVAIHVGEEVKNPAFLVGKIYEYKKRAEELEEACKNLRASLGGGGAGRVFTATTAIVDLGDELMPQLAEKAASKGMTVVAYMKEASRLAVEGDWVS